MPPSPYRKPVSECLRREGSKANSQDNAGAALGRDTDCPCVAQPKFHA